jgi:glutamine cyclotransferase
MFHYSGITGKMSVEQKFKLFIAGFLILLITVCLMFWIYSDNLGVSTARRYEIVNTYPHDREAFTQGLVYENGILYEGTGLKRHSQLRKVELQTGKVLQKYELPDEYFGEGITIFGDRIIQLTYQSNVGFVYDKETFELLGEFHYPTEGWGITHNGKHLIMSDGTPMLHFLDPETFEQIRSAMVFDEDEPVWGLNELEFIEGQIYANIWRSDRIVRIEPLTCKVTARIDMKGLLSPQERNEKVDVLNGIAYDANNKRIFVTGKLWPKLFEIKLVPKK